jgi:hypothetical protein
MNLSRWIDPDKLIDTILDKIDFDEFAEKLLNKFGEALLSAIQRILEK